MANIKVGMDVNDVKTATEQLNQLLRQSATNIGDFANKTIQFNAAGQATSATIEQMNAAGQKISTTFNLAGNGVAVMSKQIQEATSTTNQFTVSWQNLLKILEVQLFRRSVSELLTGLKEGISSAIEFNTHLAQVANITNQSGAALDSFRQKIIALSNQSGQPLDKILGASQTAITGQGGNAPAGMEVLNQSMRLAQATGTDLTATTNLLTTSIQAFGLEASQAGRVANTFFTLAQQGRVPLDQMQVAIGRVSQVARSLNIPFEQIAALFLTIEQQGGRATESMSLLTQVLSRMQNPSKAMQEFLTSIGAPTAQFAIQTHGLTTFLEQMNSAMSRSDHLMQELGGSMRQWRALAAITGDETARFTQNLNNIQNASPNNLLNAQQRFQQDPSQQLRVAANELKNIFTTDFGGPFVAGLNKIIQTMGGAAGTFRAFTESVKLGIVILAAYTAVMTGGPIAAAAFSTGIRLVIGSMVGMNAATATGISALGGFNIALTAIAAGLLLYYNYLKQIEQTNLDRILGQVTAIRDRGNLRIEQTNIAANREAETFRTEINNRNAGRVEEAARAVQLAHDIRDEVIRSHQQITQSWQVSAQTFLDTLRRNVSLTREALNQNKAELHASDREVVNFTQRANASVFQSQLSGAQGEANKQFLIQQRIAEVQAEIDKTARNRNASREEIQGARERYNELLRLTNEYYNAQQAHGPQAVYQEGPGGTREQIGYTTGSAGPDREAQQTAIRTLTQQVAEFERQHAANIATSNTRLTEQLSLQQANLRIFEALMRDAEQFRVFNDQGRLLPRFQAAEAQGINKPGGAPGAGGAAALAEFDRLSAAVRAEGQRQGVDLQDVNRLMGMRRQALLGEINAQMYLNTVTGNQRDLMAEINIQSQRGLQLINQRRDADTAITQNLGRYGENLVNISNMTNRQPRRSDDDLEHLRPQRREAAIIWNEVKDAVDAARAAYARLSAEGGRTQENFASSAAATTRLNDALRLMAQQTGPERLTDGLREARDFARLLTENFQNGTPALATFDNRMQEAFRNFQQTNQQMQQMEQNNGLGNLFRNAGQAAAQAGPQINGVLERAGALATSTADAIVRLRRELQSLQNLGPGGGVPGPATGGAGPPAPGFAAGGPTGTDTINAWLSPNEFVMNANSTRKFYSQLVSMNAGIPPRYFAEGGPVSVGDINVHVNGEGKSEKTIREIAYGINRELLRGTVRFQSLQG